MLCKYCKSHEHKIDNCPIVLCKKCNKVGHTYWNCKVNKQNKNDGFTVITGEKKNNSNINSNSNNYGNNLRNSGSQKLNRKNIMKDNKKEEKSNNNAKNNLLCANSFFILEEENFPKKNVLFGENSCQKESLNLDKEDDNEEENMINYYLSLSKEKWINLLKMENL